MENIRFLEITPSDGPHGPTYLLLHGLGCSLDFWTEVAPLVGRTRRVVALDIPGFGKSPSPPNGFTLDGVSAAIERFCDAAEITDCVIVAHSMGAVVGLRLIATDPHRFRRLILVDGTLGRAIRLLARPLSMLTHPKLAIYVLAQFAGGLVPVTGVLAKLIFSSRTMRRLSFWPYLADPAGADPAVLARALADNGSLTVFRALRAAGSVNYAGLLRAVTRPVDLAWGEADHLIDAEDVLQACELMQVDRRLRIAACSHWPMIEATEALATFITSWELERVSHRP